MLKTIFRDDFTLPWIQYLPDGSQALYPDTTLKLIQGPASGWNTCGYQQKNPVIGKVGMTFETKVKFHSWGEFMLGINRASTFTYETSAMVYQFNSASMVKCQEMTVDNTLTVPFIGNLQLDTFYPVRFEVLNDGRIQIEFNGQVLAVTQLSLFGSAIGVPLWFSMNLYQAGQAVELDSFVIKAPAGN